jgi:hypothetical protein
MILFKNLTNWETAERVLFAFFDAWRPRCYLV